jgi:hypothetical protein
MGSGRCLLHGSALLAAMVTAQGDRGAELESLCKPSPRRATLAADAGGDRQLPGLPERFGGEVSLGALCRQERGLHGVFPRVLAQFTHLCELPARLERELPKLLRERLPPTTSDGGRQAESCLRGDAGSAAGVRRCWATST